MAAADSLARANVSFVVLESTNRTGGRSQSITFGDKSVWYIAYTAIRCGAVLLLWRCIASVALYCISTVAFFLCAFYRYLVAYS